MRIVSLYRLMPFGIALILILTSAACNFPQATASTNGGNSALETLVATELAAVKATTPSVSTQAGILTQSPPLIDFKMIGEQAGWGVGGQLVWRTTDGAVHWADVTPPGYGDQGMDGRGFFRDAKTAWVLLPDAGASSGMLYQTADGGRTWRRSSTPFSDGQLFFLDNQTGWALAVSSAGAGSAEADVYQTTDGGATWTEVYKMDSSQPGAQGGLPLSGVKNGITFRDKTHGWVTGSVPRDSYVWLYTTSDGGATWQHQELETPVDQQSHELTIDPPIFFGPQNGILPVGLITDTFHWDFYVTQDGGVTWTSTAVSPGNGRYDFLTLETGFEWDSAGLHVTHDGGMTWSSIKPNVDLSQNLLELDFVTPSTGWSLALDANGDSHIFKTTDGGANWGP
jgi:photosystem II stability/assembly factor-like uncharacterized protein